MDPQAPTFAYTSQTNNTASSYHKEPLAVTIEALALIIFGFFGFILSLVGLVSTFLSIETLNTGDIYSTLNFIYLIVVVFTLGYLSILLFKISSGLHKLELAAYQSASIYYAALFSSLILYSVLSYIFNKQILTVILGLVGLLPSAILLIVLYSHRKYFTLNKITSRLRTQTIIAVILLFLSVPIGIVIQVQASSTREEFAKQQLQELQAQQENYLKQQNILNNLSNQNNTLKNATLSAQLTPKPYINNAATASQMLTPTSGQSKTNQANQSYRDGLSSITVNGVPYYMIVGSYLPLNSSSFNVAANGSTYQVQIQKFTKYTNQNNSTVTLSYLVSGDRIKVLANVKTGSIYPANYVQDLSR